MAEKAAGNTARCVSTGTRVVLVLIQAVFRWINTEFTEAAEICDSKSNKSVCRPFYFLNVCHNPPRHNRVVTEFEIFYVIALPEMSWTVVIVRIS